MIAEMWRRLPPAAWSLVVAVLVLLPVLAIFQYRWLGQVSEGERERMNALLHSAALQFSDAFDSEISRLYSLFQRDKAGGMSTLPEEYTQRLEQWETASSNPKIVRGVFLVEKDGDDTVKLLQVNRISRSLDEIAWPPELSALRERILEPAVDVIWEGIPALVIPPRDSLFLGKDTDSTSGPHLLAVIVLLDPSLIKNVFLPALASRYFVNGDGLSYNVAVASNGVPRKPIFESQPGLLANGFKAGIETGLFDLRLDTLPANNRSGPLNNGSAKSPSVLVRIIKSNFREGQSDEDLRGQWRLLVNYQPGALENKIASSRVRNLTIGLGILVLLALSIGMLIVSSARATRLAQDQINFVAGVTHELRTPLAVICSAGENLADGVVSDAEKVREYGRIIRDDGRRLTETVQQVLEHAGAQSGRSAYELQDTDVGNICEVAMAEMRREIVDAAFVLDIQIEPDLPAIKANSEALKRALQNLVRNAIKFDRGERWLQVRVASSIIKPGYRELEITVVDRGRGIPPAELPRIFEPFFRGTEITAAQIHGSGLGLSLVQQTIAAHAGRVTVESALGQGSSFTLHLPFSPPVNPV